MGKKGLPSRLPQNLRSGRGGGLPSPSAPPVPVPGTSRAQGHPCPPHLPTPGGGGQPLGFPACFLPSPPRFPTQGRPGAGWHAGSHPGLADLHIKARGPPHPAPQHSGNLPLGRTIQLEEPVWLQLPFPNCLKRVSPNCLNKSLGWRGQQHRPVCRGPWGWGHFHQEAFLVPLHFLP